MTSDEQERMRLWRQKAKDDPALLLAYDILESGAVGNPFGWSGDGRCVTERWLEPLPLLRAGIEAGLRLGAQGGGRNDEGR